MRCLICAAVRIGLVGQAGSVDSADVKSCRVFGSL